MCVRVRNRPGVLEGYSFQKRGAELDCPRHAPMRAARMTALAKTPTSRTISSTSAGSFGHVRGSLTEAVRDRMGRFEAADDCMLFLDEVGEIPARIFADAVCRRLTRRPLKLAPSDTQRLQLYDWPGNVRELQHVIERAVILSKGRSLELGPLEVRTPIAAAPAPAPIIT
jgi:DNA-binding NtrC family response regulator